MRNFTRTCPSIIRHNHDRCALGWRNGTRAKQRIQQFLQGASAAQNARFHGSNRSFQNLGNLLVREALNVAQGVLHSILHFARGKLFKWSGLRIPNIEGRLMLIDRRIERNLVAAVTAPPAAVVQSFANGNAIEPRLQRTAAAESADAAKSL